ncbi:threonine ammonia-lyase [Haliangium ochraceum]|uniref:Pyridoxal-5'-phosphate-dependent protein beta subunit n=1 Tax=Haliangium ochraceum (strain DSM 14365 / JCM 11303 / SMP-2) TaxID=502025 RepID=D0LW62_HALO1|nr:threonine/serine dehydratase [Haliangium ochraceum]ACY15994.1 Pyridoxal-5'-phosphate-dependent protein beta subunit [Haliangium ochraceum DSM 14365]
MDRSLVIAAAARLQGRVRRTPALRCEALARLRPEGPGVSSEAAGPALWLKAESLQHIGAFKARGAMHAVGRLSEEERARGVITYSSGNHAQAVALAAQFYGVAADIAMPEDAPAVKVAVVRSLGARIVFAGTTSPERREAALAIQAERGGAIVEPFDHEDIIAGQGTATLELLEDVAAHDGAPLDALLVPVGGGGLIAGACLACEGTPTKVYSVEPVGCDAMAQSLARGERVAVTPGPTLADGLKPTLVGERNFAIARARVAGSFTVDDEAIGRALAALAVHAKLWAEPSGAAALAAYLSGRVPADARRVGVIVSGGNVAAELAAELIARHGPGLVGD